MNIMHAGFRTFRQNNKKSRLHTAVLILYTLLLIVPILIGSAAYLMPHSRNSFDSGTFEQIGDGFRFVLEDGSSSDADFSGYYGSDSIISIVGRLPENMDDDTSLFVFSNDQDIIIYTDNIRKGTYMGGSQYAGGGNIPDAWYIVPLHSDDSGKQLQIIIRAAAGRAVGTVKPVYIGNKTSVIYELMRTGGFPVLSGLLMTMIGMLISIYAIILFSRGGNEYLYIGTFMVFAGLWLFFKSDIRQIYFPYADYSEIIAALSLIMLHIPLILLTVYRLRNGGPYTADQILSYAFLFGGIAYSLLIQDVWHQNDGDFGITSGLVVFSICGILEFRRWIYEENGKKRRALVSSEEKTAFLADMSHAIRTPANTILGMDTMIIRRSSDSVITGYANDIAGACQSLLSIMDDILDFSKIGYGEIRIQNVNYSLKALINDCYSMIVIRAKKKGLDFRVINDPMIPDSLFGDEIRIRQIIVNLLTNAVKYTRKGRVILEINFEQTDDSSIMLIISVRDTGIGIREENIQHLFESYRRLDEERNSHIEGTGLGLSITKQLAELMGGEISVESTYGQGSVFHVSLPQRTAGRNTIGDVEQYLEDSTGREQRHVTWFSAPEAKVLVVDDVEMNLKVMSELLGITGMKVVSAESGEECLEKTAQEHFDLIFLDHMMPGMDGEETFRKMNAMSDNKNADTHVIMLTANAISGAKEAYLKEGFSGYLAKPVKEEELKEICLAYLPKKLIIPAEKDIAVSDEAVPGRLPTDQLMQFASVLDTKEGLSNSMNDPGLYRELITDFVKKNRKIKLQETFSAKDWAAYRIHVHSLKSTSRTVGAADLGEKAFALEMAAKEGDEVFITEHHSEMMKNYEELLKKLEKIL